MIYGRSSICLEDVKTNLHNEMLRGKLANMSMENDSEGLIVQRGRSKSRPKYGGDRAKSRSQSRGARKGVCHYCRKPGHYIASCPKLENKNKAITQKASATTAETSDSGSDPGIFIASASSMKSTTWIIDSGASYHMTPDRHFFPLIVNLMEERFSWEIMLLVA